MFVSSYGFSHVTSSARFPQSNGQVDRGVQTIKRMLKDPNLTVLSYRAIPHGAGYALQNCAWAEGSVQLFLRW